MDWNSILIIEIMSYEIINEMISLMSNKVLRQILSEIRETQIFVTVSDKTRHMGSARFLRNAHL